jgi:hypothetical protein
VLTGVGPGPPMFHLRNILQAEFGGEWPELDFSGGQVEETLAFTGWLASHTGGSGETPPGMAMPVHQPYEFPGFGEVNPGSAEEEEAMEDSGNADPGVSAFSSAGSAGTGRPVASPLTPAADLDDDGAESADDEDMLHGNIPPPPPAEVMLPTGDGLGSVMDSSPVAAPASAHRVSTVSDVAMDDVSGPVIEVIREILIHQ